MYVWGEGGGDVCVYVFSCICGHTYKINGTFGRCLIYFPIRFPNLKKSGWTINQNSQATNQSNKY